jgi:AcrR family transcriptional regulator
MAPGIRLTSDEIDRALVDVAAAVFGQHGFEQGPVQAVADAAGYSKAAVLKRFGSKEQLQDLVVSRTEELAAQVAAAGAGLPAGPERDAAILTALIDLIRRWPGSGALMVGAFWLTREPGTMRRLAVAKRTLLGAFGPEVDTSEDRHVRVVAALGAVTVTVMADRDTHWIKDVGTVLAAGLDALGHHHLTAGRAATRAVSPSAGR